MGKWRWARGLVFLAAVAGVGGTAACAGSEDPVGVSSEGVPHPTSTTERTPGGADDGGATSTTAPDATGDQELAYDSYESGQCIMWDEAPGAEAITEVVACDELHRIQLTELLPVPETPDGSYPDDAVWDGLQQGECVEVADRFLGRPLSEDGRFYAVLLLPSEADWIRGQETNLWCGITIQRLDGSGSDDPDQQVTSEDALVAGQSFAYPPGTCVAYATGDPTVTAFGVVPCTEPHHVEIAGQIDVSHLAAAPTGADALAITRACEPVLAGHFGSLPRPWVPTNGWLGPRDWDAGMRTIDCFAAQLDPADNYLTVSEPAPRTP